MRFAWRLVGGRAGKVFCLQGHSKRQTCSLAGFSGRDSPRRSRQRGTVECGISSSEAISRGWRLGVDRRSLAQLREWRSASEAVRQRSIQYRPSPGETRRQAAVWRRLIPR